LNDRFSILFSGIDNGTAISSWEFSVSVSDALQAGGASPTIQLSSLGTFSVLFSEFSPTADFSQIVEIELTAVAPIDSSARSLSVSHFSAVPEPSTALLLGLGLVGLAVSTIRRVR
jgi:hypothetical protein